MVFMGTAPVGSLVAGSLAAQLTAPQMVRIGGLCCLVAALVFARYVPVLRALIQPITATQRCVQDATIRMQSAIDTSLQAHH